MRRLFVFGLALACLVGCSNNKEEKISPSVTFEEELDTIFNIENKENKILADVITTEYVDEQVFNLVNFAGFLNYDVTYGDITEGIGSDGNGGRTFCCKFPVDIEFEGDESSISNFATYFDNIDNVVSVGNFDIEEIGEHKFEVNTVVNFLGKSKEKSLDNSKKEFVIKENIVKKEEEEDIKLRDFDISMNIRPSNSDAAAVSLGVVGKEDYRVYSDKNSKSEVTIKFIKEGNNYLSLYKIGEGDFIKAPISPNGNILFDILSCDLVEDDDEIRVDVKLYNETNKKVSIMIFNDKDSRVSFSEKVGNIEVKTSEKK